MGVSEGVRKSTVMAFPTSSSARAVPRTLRASPRRRTCIFRRPRTIRRMTTGERAYYRGSLYGLPQEGPGSVAGLVRRGVSVVVDGALLYVLSLPVGPVPGWWIVAPFVALIALVVLPTLYGATPGQAAAGTTVVPLIDGQAIVEQRGLTLLTAFGRALVWSCAPLTFVISALTYDDEGRTMYDRITKTIVLLR